MRKIMILFMVLVMSSLSVFAAESVTTGNKVLYKTASTSDKWVNVNRMNGVFRNNGTWLYDNVAGDWGLEWPKGSGLSPMFAAGQWVAAKFPIIPPDTAETIRVAGIQHSASEFQPGQILEPYGSEVASNPRDGAYKWYELFPGGSGDWSNWPYDQGAPVDDEGKPNLQGNQTIFSVYNDLADHAQYGSKKLSVEVQHTVFAFNRADALGDMIFTKWRLINKSGVDWDSTYFCIWTDPDLGDAGDDLVGSDPELGLGYCYNATNNDQNYGAAPPAIGLDFFQGPIVDSPDSTVTLPDGTVLTDKKMLSMTSFMFYNNDDSPQGNPRNAKDIWNYFNGFWQDDSPIVDPDGTPQPFMFPGDPETATGWLDGNEADRRFIMATGPFTMKAWEDVNGNGLADFGEPGVQDIVAAVIVARGTSNLNSVTKLKEVDKLAQLAYDLDFSLASAPVVPKEAVTVSERPNEVVLTWTDAAEYNEDGSPYSSQDPIVEKAMGDTVIIDNTVKVIDDDSYNFYGYTLYQYSDASGRDPVKLAHWDIGGQADATPYTHQRFKVIRTNQNSAVGLVGSPLVNGKTYYFGLVAEAYLEYGAPVIFPGPPAIFTVIPRLTPGVRFHSAFNDTLKVTHTVVDTNISTVSDGASVVWVVDPSSTTGKDYTVTFNTDQTWNLTTSSGDTVAKNKSNQSGNDAYDVIDGLMVKVQGPPAGMNINKYGDAYGEGSETSKTYLKGWDFDGTRWISGVDWGGRGLFGGLDNGANFFGSTLSAADYVDVEIRFAGASDRSDTTTAGLAAVSMADDPTRWSKAALYDRDQGYAHAGTFDVPFSAWDTENNRRLNIVSLEDDRYAPSNLFWDMGWDGSAFADLGAREYVFIMASDYNEGADYNNSNWGPAADVLYAFWPSARGSHPYLEAPFEIQIFASNINTNNDIYTFTAPDAAEATTPTSKEDLDKITVVPNPYYGYHSGEMDPYNRWVQFTYLPQGSTIRIFDLAGNLINQLKKTDGDTPFLRWNLKNRFDLPVASGVYIYHVQVPGIGEKVGKLAVFTPNERLDTY